MRTFKTYVEINCAVVMVEEIRIVECLAPVATMLSAKFTYLSLVVIKFFLNKRAVVIIFKMFFNAIGGIFEKIFVLVVHSRQIQID